MKKFYLVLATVIMLGLASCTSTKISGSGTKPIVLNSLSNVELIDNFKIQKMVAFDYTESFNCYDYIAEVIKQYPEANAFTNVQVAIKSNAGSFFVNIFTLGIANAKIIEIKGDAVKFNKSFSDLQPENTQTTISLEELEKEGTIDLGTITQ